MPKKDPRVDAYIAKAPAFAQPILKQLRKVIHCSCPDVEETLKWNSPFFMYEGLLCHMAAFKEHCAFGFWKGSLIFGKDRRREAMGNFGRLTALSDLPSERELSGYIKKAMELNDAGIKHPARSVPRKSARALEVPAYFKAAIAKNRKAASIFESFSYSHKKEYVEWVVEARRDETRERRLKTAVAWLAQGKPRHWKYANC